MACCFKMGLGRNASSRAHGTTLLIHCQCANHLAQLVCNIDHRFVQHRPFWLVCGLSRHQLISQCWNLLCLSITVVHHSCTWQHLSILWFTFAGSQFLKSAFGEDRLVHVVRCFCGFTDFIKHDLRACKYSLLMLCCHVLFILLQQHACFVTKATPCANTHNKANCSCTLSCNNPVCF